MRTEQISRGVVVYQKERSDLEQEALLTLARRQAEASAADRARGAVNLVCQTVGVLAAFAARAEGVGDVVLVGTPVAHPVFSELIRMVELLHPVRFHVPPHAPFAAAIGAARAALSPANE